MFAAEADLVGRAHHALGSLAADLGLLDAEIARQNSARQSHEDTVAGVTIVGPHRYVPEYLRPYRQPHESVELRRFHYLNA